MFGHGFGPQWNTRPYLKLRMSLTINGLIVAETRIQSLALRPVLGAYELIFGLYPTVRPEDRDGCKASIAGARVSVNVKEGGIQSLGFARPEEPIEIVPVPCQMNMTPALVLPLQYGQIAALENLRAGEDLDFSLSVTGIGYHEDRSYRIQDTWWTHLPRSEWIKKLREARARDTLLLEVPIPFGLESEEWMQVTRGLK